jgi:hypothetical protein
MQNPHDRDQTYFPQTTQMGLPQMRSGDIPTAKEKRKVISLPVVSV